MDVKDLPASIVDLELFSGLQPAQIAVFLQRCRKLAMTSGQPLMKAGELADSAYLIIRGRVDVRARSGGHATTLATLEAGQLVGEMGLFRDKPYRMADAVTVRDSLVVQIPYHYLHRLEGVHQDIAACIKGNLKRIAEARLNGPAARAAPEPAAPRAAEPAPPLLVPIQIRTALARTPLFEGFDQEEQDRVVAIATPLRFRPGEAVVVAGAVADCLYVIALGRLEVVVEHDGEHHHIAQLGAGQCFGEIAFAHGNKVRAATVVADIASTVLRLAYDDLGRATSWRPETRERFQANLTSLINERQ